jgi:hypothetical protein
MCDFAANPTGVELYFVQGLVQDLNDISGLTDTDGTAIAPMCTPTGVAHELGHCTGLHDIYSSQGQESLGTDLVQEAWEPADWSNGTDCWYYQSRFRQGQVVHRLLMYGNDQANAMDIAKGRVYGVCVDDDESVYKGMQEVGLENMDRTPHHH